MKKLGAKGEKKRKVGQKHSKKEFLHLTLLIFEKTKQNEQTKTQTKTKKRKMHFAYRFWQKNVR